MIKPEKDLANWIDSQVLLNYLKKFNKLFKQNVELIGSYFYNVKNEKIERKEEEYKV
jgi:hypothetical protein